MSCEFNQGDLVVVHKPEDTSEYPTWVHGMDMYDGLVFEIRRICSDALHDTVYLRYPDGKEQLNAMFSPKWLEPYEKYDINIEDDSVLSGFLDEWR